MKRLCGRILLAAAAIALAAGCKSTKVILPNISGKAGEVIVVLDKAGWEGALGTDVRTVLGADFPMLPQPEPSYTLTNVLPSGFNDLFKVHRNILLFQIDPQAASEGVILRNNVWSQPQLVIQVSGYTAERADSVFMANAALITSAIEQIERGRVIVNTLQFENKEIYPVISELFGGGPHIPSGYYIKKLTDDFVWIANERQYTYQYVFVYSYPALAEDNFTEENIIAKRNEIMKANVPGMREDSYMTTGTYYTPVTTYLKYKGREFAETRGLWEVYNDYMGGPFVSHSFYSEDGRDIIVLEAFVYAPRFEKRQYLRQTESLLYSFEWAKGEAE